MNKVFSTGEVAISHADYVQLRKDGKVNLGVNNDISTKAIAAGIGPNKGGAVAAFHFFSWLAIGVFLVSVYFSFTHSWWWFIVGLIAMRVIWTSNKASVPSNLLDAAMLDKDFYERFRSAGIWEYELSVEDAQNYHN